ncbi:hypothetical protein U9M48_038633 [Paspalum notatum var. saurae]|uniref:Germin-like protein n=1 Tax=Paspalum notatum var. saurae TaxID=547442 RepID=A0AAQ3UM85_PASNO
MAPKPKAVLQCLVLVLVVPLLSLLPFAHALSQDFCVADLGGRDTPSGYPCKDPNSVTADDFHSSALATAGPVTLPFKTGFASATVKQWPAVNGLNLAFTRVDILPGGVVPMHTHPRASEVIFVTEGSLYAGFISADANKVYIKKVDKSELFVFPQGLLHFQYNIEKSTAVEIASYNNPNPGLQIVDYALFGNNLTVPDVVKTTFINAAEVLRLKVLFGLRSVEG